MNWKKLFFNIALLGFLISFSVLIGCSEESATGRPGAADQRTECDFDSDCPDGRRCESGECVAGNIDGDDDSTADGDHADGDHVDNVDIDHDGMDGDFIDLDTQDLPEIEADGDITEIEENPGLPPGISVPEEIEFPQLTIDQEETRDLVISSTGEGSLIITSITLSDASSPDFHLPDELDLPVSIPTEGTFGVVVSYRQTNQGFDNGSVEISSNAGDVQVALRTVLLGEPVIRCEPDPIEFELTDVDGAGGMIDLVCHNDRENEGDDNVLILSAFSWDPPQTQDFSLGSGASNLYFIRSGASESIPIYYRPQNEGDHAATLKVEHNSGSVDTPLLISASGEAGAKHISLDTEAINFGSVRLDEFDLRTVAILSAGTFPITVTGIEKVGASAIYVDDYGILDSGPLVLGPGEDAEFDVVFEPFNPGEFSAVVHVYSDGRGDEGDLIIPVTGAGTQLLIYTLPESLDFGVLRLLERSVQNLTVVNGGSTSVEITDMQIVNPERDGAFSLATGFQPVWIFPGQTEDYDISFEPVSEVTYEADLVITVNGEDDLPVPLSGEGSLTHFVTVPEERAYDFGEANLGAVETFDYTLKNAGGAPLLLTDFHWIATGGDLQGTLSVDFEGNPELGAQEEATLTLTFSPPQSRPAGSMPQHAERIYGFSTNDGDNPEIEIAFGGTMVDPYAEVQPPGPFYDFGSVIPGYAADPVNVSITNGGTGTLRITHIHLTGASHAYFELHDTPDSFPVDISNDVSRDAAVQEILFSVHYLPMVVGSHAGILRISNEGYENRNIEIDLFGVASNCPFLQHDCDGGCVSDTDVNHCGSRCEPCEPPDNADATCIQWYNSHICDFECFENFVKDDGQCLPPSSPDCCGIGCDDCTGTSIPNGVPACMDGECGFECNLGHHFDVQGDCVLNDAPDCCGDDCEDCPELDNSVPICDYPYCGFVCNENFDDCNNVDNDGCETDLLTSAHHCSSCMNACIVETGQGGCEGGECVIASCYFGRGDCNGEFEDGCETLVINDVNNCGECGELCSVENGYPSCSYGACRVGGCMGGYEDCNREYEDGCETEIRSSVDNCGRCNRRCNIPHALPLCENGICDIDHCKDCSAPDDGCDPDLNEYGRYADCDGVVNNGCEVNLTDDYSNCGVCGRYCEPQNGTGMCVDGACRIGACEMFKGDCDKIYENGCEVNLNTDIDNCGACDHPCAFANASAVCATRLCIMGPCNYGYKDCNDDNNDGCERDILTDITNCGRCGNTCLNAPHMHGASCVSGACVSGECDEGWADCNDDLYDGCETYVWEDLRNCGTCGKECDYANADNVCVEGECVIEQCFYGFDDCNGEIRDGCEIEMLSDPNHCGGCGDACDLPNTDQHLCLSGDCAVGACDTGYGDCSDELEGCETNIRTDPDNCGECHYDCNVAHTSQNGCSEGVCYPVACYNSWGDCNGYGPDGCEASLSSQKNNCGDQTCFKMTRFPSYTDATIRGDTGSDVTWTYSDWGDKWFRIKMIEASDWCTPVRARATLYIPSGVNYNLELWEPCGSRRAVSSGTGSPETLYYCSDDHYWGIDDNYWLFIHVTFASANNCAEWSIKVEGNKGGGCGCVL